MKRLLTLLALALATATSFGATLNPIQLLNPAGSTAGQAIVSTGPSTAPAWAPVTATALASQAANTVVANVTATSASPTAVALPSCSTANSALKYTTSTGFSCGTTYALTSGTLAQFSATTSAQLLGVISDETGSGSLVFGTSPTLVTPILGTPASVTLTNGTGLPISTGVSGLGAGVATGLSSAATGTGGPVLTTAPTINQPNLVGITNGSSAPAGSLGELQTNSAASVSLTTATVTNITSITLPAGFWDCQGTVRFNAAAGTTLSQQQAGISTTSATVGAVGTYVLFTGSLTTSNSSAWATPVVNVNVSTSTTVYLIGQAQFATSTMTAAGFMRCLRAH